MQSVSLDHVMTAAYYAAGPPLRTVGALDLGGSSLEVTFLPPPGAAISADADKGASHTSHSCKYAWYVLALGKRAMSDADVSSQQDPQCCCRH